MAGIRLSGLASGIDTESMIKQLMQAARAPIDRLSQKKQILSWKRDSYREINRSLLDIRTATSDMLLSKNYQAKSAVSSNNNILNVTSNSTATPGSLTIEKIDRLAESSSLTVSSNNSTKITSKTLLKDSNVIGIDSSTNKTNLEIKTYSADGSGISKTVSINLDSTSTIADLINQINSSKDLGLNAVFNDITGKIVLSRQSTGKLNSNAEIEWNDKNSNSLDVQPALLLKSGVNASYQIGGTQLEQLSNTFSQNGLTITLNSTSNIPVTITTKNDIQANFDSIKNFIDKYNVLIDKMNSKVREEKYRDYQPLTDAQRKELSEEEIKKWEEKAVSGILKNDSLIQEGLNKFRSSLSSIIDTGYTVTNGTLSIPLNNLSQIGITSTNDFRDGGKIKIDESKLKKMLEEHSEGVYKLFTVDAVDKITNSEGETISNPKGIDGFIRQIQQFSVDLRNKITVVAGREGAVSTTYRIGKNLIDIDRNIISWEDKVKRQESAYYRRFAAMEQAMNQANSQSTALTNYLT